MVTFLLKIPYMNGECYYIPPPGTLSRISRRYLAELLFAVKLVVGWATYLFPRSGIGFGSFSLPSCSTSHKFPPPGDRLLWWQQWMNAASNFTLFVYLSPGAPSIPQCLIYIFFVLFSRQFAHSLRAERHTCNTSPFINSEHWNTVAMILYKITLQIIFPVGLALFFSSLFLYFVNQC